MTAPRTAFEAWLAERGQQPTETSPVVFMEKGVLPGHMRDFRPQPIHPEAIAPMAANPSTSAATPAVEPVEVEAESEPGKDDSEPPVAPPAPTLSAMASVPTLPGSVLGGDLAPATAGKVPTGPARVVSSETR
jgi:hypothetical protein